MLKSLTIATRESPLALWQAHHIKSELTGFYPELEVCLLGMTSRGDQLLDIPLNKVGGKGLFVKELETALIDGSADIAVHSMKDVPMEFPSGLALAVICEREDPRDAFVSNDWKTFKDLPLGSILGTSSLRRACQLQEIRPDLTIRFLRGNVNTRLGKLDNGEYDAIILASAGLIRLGMKERISEYLDVSTCLPAGGQGAIGIECRDGDAGILDLLKPLDHVETSCRVRAERALNARLEGGCQFPIASFAELDNDQLILRGLVGKSDGSIILRAEERDIRDNAEVLGVKVAENLIAQGARELLVEGNDQ